MLIIPAASISPPIAEPSLLLAARRRPVVVDIAPLRFTIALARPAAPAASNVRRLF